MELNLNKDNLEYLGILLQEDMVVLCQAIEDVGIVIDTQNFIIALLSHIQQNNLLTDAIDFKDAKSLIKLKDFIIEITSIISYLDIKRSYNNSNYSDEIGFLFELITNKTNRFICDLGESLDPLIYSRYRSTSHQGEDKNHLRNAIYYLEERIKTNFRTILNSKTLINRLECIKVLRENINTFSNITINADFRLLLDKKETINGQDLFGLVHNLKLNYVVNGKLKEFFITLDEIDLNLVIDTLLKHRSTNKKLIEGVKEGFNLVKF